MLNPFWDSMQGHNIRKLKKKSPVPSANPILVERKEKKKKLVLGM